MWDNVLITAWSQNEGADAPQGPEGAQQEVVMKACLKSQRNSASIPPLKPQLQKSAAQCASVDRKVMPTQRCTEGQSLCKKTLKFLSDRRWWHLVSSADIPSRNTVQGQLMLLPRFSVQWNSSCHKTNLCKPGFVQKKMAMSTSLNLI